MGQEPLYDTPDFRAFKAALEEEWPQRQTALHASGVPLNDDPDPDPDPDPEADPDPDPEADPEAQTFSADYVKKLRDENARRRREAADLAGRLKAHEDAEKSELEREQEARTTAEQRAAAAESASLRLEVALDKAPEGMSVAQIRKLAKRLTGSTQEELEADAEELFSEFAPDTGREPDGRRPRERLRPGAAPSSSDDDEETDPAKLAARVRRPY